MTQENVKHVGIVEVKDMVLSVGSTLLTVVLISATVLGIALLGSAILKSKKEDAEKLPLLWTVLASILLGCLGTLFGRISGML